MAEIISQKLFKISQNNVNQGKMAHFPLNSGENTIFYWYKSGKIGRYLHKIGENFSNYVLDTLIQ